MERLIEHLTFYIGSELYAINASNVKKIIQPEPEEIRPVPNQPTDIRGITLYGKDIVPVIDLRVRFHLKSEKSDEIPFIIISRVDDDEFNELVVGFVVDSAVDVVAIDPNDKENLKTINSDFFGAPSKYISAIYRQNKSTESEEETNKLVIILDVEKLLSKNEIKTILESA